MTDSEFLEILKAEREIKNVMHSYVRGCDRKDYGRVRAAYHDDAFDDHGPIKAHTNELMEWIQKYNTATHQMMHLISEPYIEWHGQVAAVETYCLLIQQMNATVEGQAESPRYVTIACRYADRFEKRNGQWRIAHRVVIYEAIRDVLGIVSPPEGARFVRRDFTAAVRSQKDTIYGIATAHPPR